MWTALDFLTIGSGRFLANTISGFTNDKSLETFVFFQELLNLDST